MALIKLTDIGVNDLEQTSLEQGYLFKDLFLDLKTAVYYNKSLNKQNVLKDVQGSYDEQAIKNSVANCFLTAPGEKLLSPEFGIDLRRYLFEPVSQFISFSIQDDIITRLPLMEPRINIDNVNVTPDSDNHQYFITLQINIPSLNVYGLSIRSLLNNNGYYII